MKLRSQVGAPRETPSGAAGSTLQGAGGGKSHGLVAQDGSEWGTGTWAPKLGPMSGQDTQLHPPHALVPGLTQATSVPYQQRLLHFV